MKERRHPTQAVVVIHGIGEQKPMDTLRSFVETVLPEPESGPQYFSRPDSLSEQFELRKLQNRTRPRTHFFELYWADKAQGTRFVHVLTWLKTLLCRPSWRVPEQLLLLWLICWWLILLTLFGPFVPWVDEAIVTLEGLPVVWGTVIGATLLLAVNLVVIGYIGDAARYLSPNPKNIAMRRAIRADGITLLRKLHECGDYERIIVVGHSLGGVIAYDILKHYWEECSSTYLSPRPHDQPALTEAERLGLAMQDGGGGNVEDFRSAQFELWKELRSLGNPWLVTDLVTLGNPLTHAAILLARDDADLAKKQQQRELPTCPPFFEAEREHGAETRRFSFRLWRPFERDGKRFHLRSLHHAAHFACTRWTNLYIPAHLGLFGDIIGGPLAGQFGAGIRDVKVTTGRWFGLADYFPTVHMMYWPTAGRSGKAIPAVRSLIAALDLEGVLPGAKQAVDDGDADDGAFE